MARTDRSRISGYTKCRPMLVRLFMLFCSGRCLHVLAVDFDPRKAARDERKERIAKNERQRLANSARDQGTSRKAELDKTLATTRLSTASMGKFDKTLDGEKKLRGIKRKFAPNKMGAESEKKGALALLSRMESDGKKMRREPPRSYQRSAQK